MKVVYSILLDNHPKSFYHAWLLVQSLLQNAEVGKQNIFVQYVSTVPEIWQNKLWSLGINLFPIEWNKSEEYAFKVKQLAADGLPESDFIVLLDTNLFFLESLEEVFSTTSIVGKIVDLPNPDIQVLTSVYHAAGFSEMPKPCPADIDKNTMTFNGNMSGGLYIIPKKLIKPLKESWANWINWFAENKTQAASINNSNQISQVAFSMAAHEASFPITYLPRSYNCPTHLHFSEDTNPKVLHHFNQFTKLGLLYNHNPSLPTFSAIINQANQRIGQFYENTSFWEFRYRFYPELGAGIGSREENKTTKIALLEKLNISESDTILDVGCGDLSIFENFQLKNYVGMDCSTEAIKIALKKRPDLNFQFMDTTNMRVTKKYDTVICLEVLNHQKDRGDYERLINFLVNSTKKRLIVSGYNKKEPHHDTNHMIAFHEPLAKSLVELEAFDNIRLIAKYSDVQVLLAEKNTEKKEEDKAVKPKKEKRLFGFFTR